MKLSVRYTGTKPATGRMSALEVGPAILGIGEMVGEASRIMYGDELRVRVDVRADFEHASFGIEFFLVSTLGQTIANLTLEQIAALSQVLGFSVSGAAGGLIAFLRWQRSRKIEKVEPKGDTFNITAEGGSTVNVTKVEYKVYMNPRIREAVEMVVRPLEQPGVESLEIKQERKDAVRIERKDRDALMSAPLPEQQVAVDKSTGYVEVVSPVFREGNKWRFAQGEASFHAAIVDEVFLADVARHNRTFGAGDVLRVDLELRTVFTPKGPDYRRTITKVHEHITAVAGRQLPLDLPPADTGA